MRQFQTNVLDFKFVYDKSFETEPFECAWATEALFFVRIEEISGRETALTVNAQISVDGIHWIDEGSSIGPLATKGDYFMRVTHFGGFLRIRCSLLGQEPKVQLTNNLVLKE